MPLTAQVWIPTIVTARPAGSTYWQLTTARLLLSKPGTSRVVTGWVAPGNTTSGASGGQ
jgi:hypothetical protein